MLRQSSTHRTRVFDQVAAPVAHAGAKRTLFQCQGAGEVLDELALEGRDPSLRHPREPTEGTIPSSSSLSA